MKLKLLSLSLLAALFVGCSSDVADEQAADNNQESPEVINATIEHAQVDATSRATFASDASFIWTADDRIGVSQTNGSTTSFSTFRLSKGAGTANGTFIGSISSGYTIGNKLVYPKSQASSLSGSTLTLNLPAEYEYPFETESFGSTTGDINPVNMPMLANYTGGGVEFKHLGGYFVFEISKIPSGCNKFEFEAVNNKRISGTFTVNTSASEPCYNTSTSASEKKITINFPETTSECKRLFIVPVPVGSYEYEWSIYDKNGDIRGFGASDDAISVSRGQIKAKRLDCASISTGDDSGASTGNMVNGHEFVDLGLSVKWATMNVGASTPEEYGDYFAWGETEPYYTAGHSLDSPCTSWKIGKTAGYDMPSYKWWNGSDEPLTKYCTYSYFVTFDNRTTLDSEDDAARANWGGTWRMPTIDELNALRTICTWTWTTQNGIYGRKVIGPNGNSIFLPAAGSRHAESLYNAGSSGCYWSSSLYDRAFEHANGLDFNSDYVDWPCSIRSGGLSVRAVCP